MFNIEEELKKLPKKPGVYLMKDKDDNIIYIGKAINLKNRVSSYFRKTEKTNRILKMVSLIDHFEYIIVDNEAEALILECNLIKENRPKFNVLLKDDKTYPYIKIDVKSEYPNVVITRRIINDGSKYFGPYANPGAAKEMLNFIKEKYKIRQCRNFKSTQRPCLNYHIKRCMAPCVKYVSKDEYMKQIYEIIDLLEGKTKKVIKDLEEQMKYVASKQEYEKAIELRDRKIAIERVSRIQKVSNISENNIDVIGIARSQYEVCIEIFLVRRNKMVRREHYFFNDLNDMEDEEILSGFIKQFYFDNPDMPSKIMVREDLDDEEILENWLAKKAEHKVEIHSTKRGRKLRFVEMAENNAKVTLDNKERGKNSILLELKDILKTNKLPKKIETYDISNLSGDFMVAAMCVLEYGKINRNLSRRFRIRTVFKQNDTKCMEEVVTRRLAHSANLKDKQKDPRGNNINDNRFGNKRDIAFGEVPDAIFVDGGITQIRAVRRAVNKYDADIKIFGMVKNYKHQTKALIDEDRNELKISQDLMLLITKFQDTVHDTAISYHRKLREKDLTSSELDKIEGIGKVRKKQLLKEFGSVEKIREVSIEDICEIPGINRVLAIKIKEVIK